MTIKAVADSLDDVEEALRPLYAEDEKTKKFVLHVEGIDDHPRVRGVITANAENKRKRDEYKARVDELEAKVATLPEDFDADQWVTLKAAANGQKPDAALQSQKENFEQRIAAMQKKYDTDMAAKDAVIATKDRTISSRVVKDGLKQALLEAGVDRDLLGGAEALLTPSVKVREDGGDVVAVVDTDLGEQSLDEFVKGWAQGKTGQRYIAKAEGPNAPGSQRLVALGDNPFTAKAWNKTQQTTLPADRRESLAKAAGFPDYATAVRATKPTA